MSDSTAQLETLAGPEPAHLRHGQQGGHGSKGEDPKPDEPVLRTGMVMAAADAEKQMESRDEEQDEERDGDGQGWLKPTPNFTGHQLWYVFVLDGLGGMLVSGGVNFALAYGMLIKSLTMTKRSADDCSSHVHHSRYHQEPHTPFPASKHFGGRWRCYHHRPMHTDLVH